MNLEFSEDQKFVQHTAREFLAKNAGLDVCRKVLESNQVTHDAALWKGVAEMGWLGAVVPEAQGGAGLGYLELVLIAEEIGRALAPIPFSSSVFLATEALLLAGSAEQKKQWLPRLAAGEAIGPSRSPRAPVISRSTGSPRGSRAGASPARSCPCPTARRRASPSWWRRESAVPRSPWSISPLRA